MPQWVNSSSSSPSRIYASVNWVSIGSDNGLSPIRRQDIILTNAGLLSIGPLGTNFSEVLIKIQYFSFTKMQRKTSSAMAAILSRGDESNQEWMREVGNPLVCLLQAVRLLTEIMHYAPYLTHAHPGSVCVLARVNISHFRSILVPWTSWINDNFV